MQAVAKRKIRFQVFCFGGDFVTHGKTFEKKRKAETKSEKAQRDNRANQLNPNNYAYWASRGYVYRDDEEDD